MKYFSKITLGLILCTGFLFSCKDDDETRIDGITVDKEEITIGAEGGTEKISVSANDQWGTCVTTLDCCFTGKWYGNSRLCSCYRLNIGKCCADSTGAFSMDGREPKLVTVTQFGFGKQILVKEPEVEIPSSDAYKKRHFETTISTNVKFRIEENVDYSFAEEATMTEEEKRGSGGRTYWLADIAESRGFKG